MARAPPPKTSNSAAGRFASSKSATAMASAAVTAALAAAALVPFEMSLGCLPAKGDSRNFVIEMPLLWAWRMAFTSLSSAAVFESNRAAGTSSRLADAQAWAANSAPLKFAHNTTSPVVTERLAPKSMESSAPSLVSASTETRFTSTEMRLHESSSPCQPSVEMTEREMRIKGVIY
jgi:hypothetical protein